MPICFASRNPGDDAPLAAMPIQLGARQCDALAELLPVLICGEESANLVFAQLAQAPTLSAQAHRALAGIERDEATHEQLLLQVRAALPEPPVDAALLRAARHFFLRLHEVDIGRHFARITALDSAVCILLGALRHHTGRWRAPRCWPVFLRVSIATKYAMWWWPERMHASLIGASQARAIAIDTRHQLVELLRHRADALEQILGVDPDKLFVRLRNPARTLFA